MAGEQLNTEQARAVHAIEGPVLIRAGAGAGKTKVLTHRACLILENKPGLLFVTFTNRAAREIQSRLSSAMDGVNHRQKAGISTLHSFALNWILAPLRDMDGLEIISRRKGMRIARWDERRSFSESAMETMPVMASNLLDKSGLSEKDMAACLAVTNANAVPAFDMKGEDAIIAGTQVGCSAAQCEAIAEGLPLYARAIEQQCRDQNVIDFDQMLLGSMELLHKHDDVAQTLRDRFPYIQVDEFQDTNCVQLAIVKAIAGTGGNCCVVGDDRQAIYGFRGARADLLAQFLSAFPSAQILDLRLNHRSSSAIVDVANACARAMPTRHNLPCSGDMQARQKALRPIVPEWWKFKNESVECDALIDAIRNNPHTNILIVYRTRYLKTVLEDAMTEGGIEYEVLEDKGFFEYREVQWALDMVRAASSDAARNPWVKTIGRVPVGVSEKRAASLWSTGGLEAIKQLAHSSSSKADLNAMLGEFGALSEALRETEKEPNAVLGRFGIMKSKLTALWNHWLDDEMRKVASQAIKSTNPYRDQKKLAARMHTAARRTEILFDIIQRVWWRKRDMSGLLEEIESYAPQDRNGQKDLSPVMLSTVHSAKGLESDWIFYLGGGDVDANTTAISDEERRVFYVAITRARMRLIITECENRPSQGAKQSSRIESPFKGELGDTITTNYSQQATLS